MKFIRQCLQSLHRDWRSGELRLIAIAVVIAVASLTSVHFFTDRVRQATEMHATELLAADLVIGSPDPIAAEVLSQAHTTGLITTLTTGFNSVVIAGDKMQMAEVKAVEAGYPIRGKLRTAASLFGDEKITNDLPEPGTVWADSRLLQALGLEVGDVLNLGASQFPVTRILTYEPDRGGDLFNIGPRLLMQQSDLPSTQLILPGSRVQYRLLVGGDMDMVQTFRAEVERQYKRQLRIQSIRDARPELRTALERAEQFLGLAALVSVALAGLAVAMSAQRYAVRHFDHCAIMRCLGAEQATITKLYLTQLLILSISSSLVGSGLGYLAQAGLSAMASGFMRDTLPAPSLQPFATGLATGIITVLGFAMPQILRLRNVTPLRVLRRDLEPLPIKNKTTYLFAIIALALMTPWQSGNFRMTFYVFFGMLATGLVLTLCTHLLISCLNRLRSRVGVAYRYGLANIARRKNQSVSQILGIGLGVMVMLLLTLIRTDLLENWRDRLPLGTPNYFLINIQPDQVDALQTYLRRNGVHNSSMNVMIRARLAAINGKAVEPDKYVNEESRRMADRNFNLTWAAELRKSNRLVAGTWWDENSTGQVEFSLEQEIARELGVNLHDRLTYTISGREVTGKITSIRWIDWDSFDVNFFVVANPGALDGYPGTWLTSLYLPPEQKSLVIDLVRNFPSVTVIDVDAIVIQVRTIMNQVIRTVEFVFGFTLLAGLVVLLAALQTTHDERIRESALLSALGANRKQILASLIAEFLCLGLAAGVLAAFAATIIEAVLAEFIFRMEIVINPWVWLIAPSICLLLIVSGGLAGTRKVLKTPPMVALRNG
ncbi:MAG: FtsX-like permease family protein [Gammaproteobacteria bacterium]|nr:FtsX-like permease family protein [Gammaproteobacteria bacterium]